ncbi:MAG: hypothetical protein IKP20_03930 [Candidatus Methanomethylophilaceae archaeon]|nr:hypothetical protein [Candidatus Methanomethylophilaceae archaeon]
MVVWRPSIAHGSTCTTGSYTLCASEGNTSSSMSSPAPNLGSSSPFTSAYFSAASSFSRSQSPYLFRTLSFRYKNIEIQPDPVILAGRAFVSTSRTLRIAENARMPCCCHGPSRAGWCP